MALQTKKEAKNSNLSLKTKNQRKINQIYHRNVGPLNM